MELFVAMGDCGDYYCDGEHFLGVFDSSDKAIKVGEEYSLGGSSRTYSVGNYALNEKNPDHTYG